MPKEKYKCLRCDHEYEDAPGPTHCPECGHIYIDWLTYEQNHGRKRKKEKDNDQGNSNN